MGVNLGVSQGEWGGMGVGGLGRTQGEDYVGFQKGRGNVDVVHVAIGMAINNLGPRGYHQILHKFTTIL